MTLLEEKEVWEIARFDYSNSNEPLRSENLASMVVDAFAFSRGNNIRLGLYFLWVVQTKRANRDQPQHRKDMTDSEILTSITEAVDKAWNGFQYLLLHSSQFKGRLDKDFSKFQKAFNDYHPDLLGFGTR